MYALASRSEQCSEINVRNLLIVEERKKELDTSNLLPIEQERYSKF
jgi:hypothetical protein